MLYEEDDLKIINQDTFINDYIDNHLFIVPYKSRNLSGFTDRFSFNSYIFYDDDIKIKYQTKNENIIENLKIGRLVALTFLEFNHYIYSYILHSNNYQDILLDSSIKKEYKINDSDIIIELIIFGKEIDKITLEEALYILTESNYDKNIQQFQKEFINLSHSSKDNILVTSKYFNINNIPKEKDFNNFKNSFIKVKIKKKEDDFNEKHKKRKYICVIGKRI